jgi:hypothetical protein
MSAAAPLEFSAEKLYPRSDNDLKLSSVFREVHKLRDGIEGGCQIGIPEADVVWMRICCSQDPLPDCFRFATVWLEIQYRKPGRIGHFQRFQKWEGSIRAAIVHKEECDAM